jgi:hypothetical protein
MGRKIDANAVPRSLARIGLSRFTVRVRDCGRAPQYDVMNVSVAKWFVIQYTVDDDYEFLF